MSQSSAVPAIARLAVVVGSRPEVIKLYPVIAALRPWVRQKRLVLKVLSTGQQRDLLDQTMGWFTLRPDADLATMDPEADSREKPENPAFLHARLVDRVTRWLLHERVDRVVVQGDTSSAHAAALAAQYCGVPVSHVEAGLRTWQMTQPFPEELHRRAISLCADQHFCPTQAAFDNLLRDGIDTSSAHVVGNTVIDTLRLFGHRAQLPPTLKTQDGRRVFVTVHRRENHRRLTDRIIPALLRVLADNPDVYLVFSVHPNPAVRRPLTDAFADHPRVILHPPLDYGETIALLKTCTLVVTDSGGLQEECAALGTPSLVLRETTERQEAVDAGNAILPGFSALGIANALHRLLADDQHLAAMSSPSDVFGDGHAAGRIASLLLASLGVAVVVEGVA